MIGTNYELMKREKWPSAKRVAKARADLLTARAARLSQKLPKWRWGKRLERLEKKVDMPFIHDSGLSHRVDDLEATINKFLISKEVRK